jgi:hypothetical protein
MRSLLLAILATGCMGGGALHQARLGGQCAADDHACARRQPMAPLAIGARFHPDVSTEVPGSTTPNLVLESAEPRIIAIEDGALVARGTGTSAVLITTDDGAIVDFIHVWAAPATKLTLARRDGDRVGSAVGLAVGEDLTLQPVLWSGAQRLTGDADPQWEVGDASVVSILRDGSSDRRRLRARAPGKTSVRVGVGELATTLDLEVVP